MFRAATQARRYTQNNMLTKQEIERERNKWVLRVLLAFIVVVLLMICIERIATFFDLPKAVTVVLFLIFGLIYLVQIYSYRNIKCNNCGESLFTQFNIFFPIPKECKNCKAKIN